VGKPWFSAEVEKKGKLAKNKKGARIEIQPRFKIQYPMKNRCNVRLLIWIQQYLKVGIL
jgi:hypothetical protein